MSRLTTTKQWAHPLHRDVTLYIYTPSIVNQNTKVLIMHDGQNLFETDSNEKHCWRLEKAIDVDKENIMIVGIDCADGMSRLDEYSPFVNEELQGWVKWINRPVGGFGYVYLDWIVDQVLPIIQQDYQLHPPYTMAGSSMGGVISLMALCRYPHHFKAVASLSGAFWFKAEMIINTIKQSTFVQHKVYLDYGTKESEDAAMNQAYQKSNESVSKACQSQSGLMVEAKVIKGGIHHEDDWHKRIGQIIKGII